MSRADSEVIGASVFTQRGILVQWQADEGVGVVELSDKRLAWVHVSAIAEPAWTEAHVGMALEGSFETADQDGYSYRAVQVDRQQP
jgi:hypothetical protein